MKETGHPACEIVHAAEAQYAVVKQLGDWKPMWDDLEESMKDTIGRMGQNSAEVSYALREMQQKMSRMHERLTEMEVASRQVRDLGMKAYQMAINGYAAMEL